MSNLRIVLPMAGTGIRFSDAGYKEPKPFINVFGMSMIQHVIEKMQIPRNSELIVIHLESNGYIDRLHYVLKHVGKKFHIETNLVVLKEKTEGCADTVLAVEKYINNNDPVYVCNCDQVILQDNYMQSSFDFFRKYDVDAGTIVYNSRNSSHSFVVLSDNLEIEEWVEKEVVSNVANVGVYYSSSGHNLVNAINRMIEDDFRVNGEFYLAPAFNYYPIESLMLPYFVNDVYSIGSPELLRKYLGVHSDNIC